MAPSKQQHLDPAKMPKRILSLDGGGIRGILTLEYLGAIESMLRQRTGNKSLLLSDYFDLIGGTSTGSIIAAGLACGMSVDQLKTLYQNLGKSIFVSKFWKLGLLAPKFPAEPVQQALDAQLGAETTLGSDKVRTGLMVMTKRLDTGSPWPLHNHPNARYAAQDGALLLSHVVRASTAAPTYFEPQTMDISARDGTVVHGVFVDGGVSPFNDPSYQLLMLALLDGHGFRWSPGKDNLLLISLGTGTYKKTFSSQAIEKMATAEQGLRSLQSLMDDCSRLNQTTLQWLTNCLTPWQIDRAVQNMEIDSKGGPQLATYARYDVILDPGWLKTGIGIDRTADDLAKIAQMDNAANMDQLAEIGRIAASHQVKPEHFSAQFDVK
jgi:uncharacterized protein